MTTQQLHDLILADPEAKALADIGDDTRCAVRCSTIAPKMKKETRLSYIGIMNLLGPVIGARLITSVDAGAASGHPVLGPVLTEARIVMRGEGVNITHPATIAQLDALVGLGVSNGLMADDAAAIKALAEFPQTITADQVSEAWASERNQ